MCFIMNKFEHVVEVPCPGGGTGGSVNGEGQYIMGNGYMGPHPSPKTKCLTDRQTRLKTLLSQKFFARM